MREKSSRTSFGGPNRGAVWLALFAIALRALVPAGWIPGDFSQGIPLVICTAAGAVTLPVDIDGHPIKAPAQDSAGENGCVFAAAAPLALSARPALPAPFSRSGRAKSDPDQRGPAPPQDFQLPQSRAPPVFS
jgi:hypothetical protein